MSWTRCPRSTMCWGHPTTASCRNSSSRVLIPKHILAFFCVQSNASKPSHHSITDRSRAMHFNFPPKKGTGISRLIPSCPAPALSLLYQMLAYDPDERITAETALRHTYFREIRCATQIRNNSQPFKIICITENCLLVTQTVAQPPSSCCFLADWQKGKRRAFTDSVGLWTV